MLELGEMMPGEESSRSFIDLRHVVNPAVHLNSDNTRLKFVKVLNDAEMESSKSSGQAIKSELYSEDNESFASFQPE